MIQERHGEKQKQRDFSCHPGRVKRDPGSVINILLMDKYYYVYILTNKKKGTLYTGITSDLGKRVFEHKNNLVEGFTKQYNVHKLVYFEQHCDVNEAILREKRIKKWKRQWKIDLIEKNNNRWRDLYFDIV